MSEETFERKIAEQVERIDDAVKKMKSFQLAGEDAIEFVLSLRIFLQDLSVSEVVAYNPYEVHPQGQKFFPCPYMVIIAEKVAQSRSKELNEMIIK